MNHGFPDKARIEAYRKTYPAGTRVELVKMDAHTPSSAPVTGDGCSASMTQAAFISTGTTVPRWLPSSVRMSSEG